MTTTSRIEYYEDWDDDREANLAMGRAEAAKKSTLNGRPGQKVLRTLRAALLALPEPRLRVGALSTDGVTCAIGALVAYTEGIKTGRSWVEEFEELEAIESVRYIYDMVKPLGMSQTLAWVVMEENDEMYFPHTLTSEERERKRHANMIAWCDEHIKE